eukprot:7465266-Alexandrium_andersonii.AAC.1
MGRQPSVAARVSWNISNSIRTPRSHGATACNSGIIRRLPRYLSVPKMLPWALRSGMGSCSVATSNASGHNTV